MKVCIDKKRWVFLAIKHEDLNVIGDLVWIEAQHLPVHVAGLDHTFLRGFTDLQMMALYKNTTGVQATRVGDSLRNILFELAERIPVREVNKFEADRQANLIPDSAEGFYGYAPGQFTPIRLPAKPTHDGVRVPKSSDEMAIAARPRIKPPAPSEPAPGTYPQPAPAARSSGAPRAPSAPRTGGVRELIWQVADKMWEAAGSPKDTKTVLTLRKEMMNVLEAEHNVKRTSSSNELGNWMKARMA